ncbi:MAG: hypothetical protein WD431_06965 [Cyclobacteriaceae bacterium]
MKKFISRYFSLHKAGIMLWLGMAGIFIACHPKSPNENKHKNETMGKAFISFRIGSAQSLSEARFNALLDLFDKYKGVTDEITLFTSTTHAPLPLHQFKERMLIFKKRMEAARQRGYKTGLNILTTIGHHEEALEHSLQEDYQNVMDIDGNVSEGSFCPNDPNLQEHIRELYKAMTQANPDYIWLDDDIRLAGHMPVYLTCFCNHCLSIFESETGKKYTRESFRKAVNEGDKAHKLALRKSWLQHNRNTIANLFKLIENTVHEIRPDMPLGFMTGDRFFEGYDFDEWATILSGEQQSPVMWRPGGGYYQDVNTPALVDKSHAIGRQVSVLPDHILSIQSEIENFPYQRLKKAANIVVLEASSHIAAGSTGAAFNVLSMYDEPLDEYEPLIAKLHEARPFFDLMSGFLGRSQLTGIHTFWNKDSFSTRNLEGGSWFNAGNPVVSHEMYDIGLPASYSKESSPVVILAKDDIYVLSNQEIEKILSRGVYMDAETLQQLNDKGYGNLTGFEIVGSASADRIEKFTNHPLNGDFGGRERDNRQSFWKSMAYTLQETEKNAQALSGLIDYDNQKVGSCTMGIFENSLGGRICVAGYYPWTFHENLSKSTQLKSVFRWLSKDTLPGYVTSFHKVNIWIREPQDDKIALAYTNSSFDPAVDIELKLLTKSKFIRVYGINGDFITIESSEKDGPYETFEIPSVGPWQPGLIVTD